MEFRVLQYFLAIAREESVSRAAESLHLSQPTLSRLLKDMEEELGKQLVIRRGSHSVSLTEEGMILRKRAEEIVELVRRTENELAMADINTAGEICFAAGEADGIRVLAKVIETMKKDCPLVTYQFSSGNSTYVKERLDKGLADFGVIYGTVDPSRYETLSMPISDRWGVLMRKDCPMAKKKYIKPEDLIGLPLILSHQESSKSLLTDWFGEEIWEQINAVATYNLAVSASILTSEGVGYTVTFDKLINAEGTNLCFCPLEPTMRSSAVLVWKKYQELGKAQ